MTFRLGPSLNTNIPKPMRNGLRHGLSNAVYFGTPEASSGPFRSYRAQKT
jgi:hypothetical protein